MKKKILIAIIILLIIGASLLANRYYTKEKATIISPPLPLKTRIECDDIRQINNKLLSNDQQ